MVTVILIVAGLVVGLAGYAAYRALDRAFTAEKDCAAAQAGLKGAHSAADRFEKLFLEREKLLKEERREHAAEVETLLNRLDEVRRQSRAAYDGRETRLVSQIQTLTDRMSRLRLSPVSGSEGEYVVTEEGSTPFFADESIPYSNDLHEFVVKLETEEMRQMVEDYIEQRRALHEDDAQILERLKRGDY